MSIEMNVLVNLQSDELNMLKRACVTLVWEQVNFSPKNLLKSPGFGSLPSLKENQILKVAF